MFSYIKGTVAEILSGSVSIEVGGIGYEVHVPTGTLSALQTGDAVKLYVHMAVREDDVSLYGFLAKNEKNMFLRLTSVSGVGCKVALGIMSGLSVQDLAAAVSSGNLAALSSIKGIGKKTAERIVLELKDKVTQEFGLAVPLGDLPQSAATSNTLSEAILALVSLGLSKSEAAAAVAKIPDVETLRVEQVVLLALKS